MTNPNDMAFPVERNWPGTALGLTKREQFAAMAMQGFLAEGHLAMSMIASAAVAMADELIESLNETKEKPHE